MLFKINRCWEELREESIEVEADTPEIALQLASDFDKHPMGAGEFIETGDVHMHAIHNGKMYESTA